MQPQRLATPMSAAPITSQPSPRVPLTETMCRAVAHEPSAPITITAAAISASQNGACCCASRSNVGLRGGAAGLGEGDALGIFTYRGPTVRQPSAAFRAERSGLLGFVPAGGAL